jgi:hypothetical protein
MGLQKFCSNTPLPAIDQLMLTLTLIANFCEVFVQEVESVSRRMGC